MIETDRLIGSYRLTSAVRGDPAAASALGRPAERPVPAQDMRQACRVCRIKKRLGEFRYHKSYGRSLNSCSECANAHDRARY